MLRFFFISTGAKMKSRHPMKKLAIGSRKRSIPSCTPKRGDSSISLLTQEEGKKTVSRCKNTFFLPRSRRLSPRRDGIYMHDSRKLNGSTSDRGHLFNCTKQTVHARWKIHAPLSYRIRKLAGRRGQIGLSAIKHGIRSNRSERASSFIFIGSTPSPARHTCPPLPYNSSCWLQNSAFCRQITGRRHPDPVSNAFKSH